MLSSTITTKGQVTIPYEIRQQLHLKPGDKVAFIVEEGHVILSGKINNIEAAFGLVKSKRSVSLSQMEKAIKKGGGDDRS